MRRSLLTLVASLALAGCGEQGPICSSPNVIDTVIEIARKKILKEAQSTLDPDIQRFYEGDYSLSAIRTNSSGNSRMSCSAEMHISMKESSLRPIAELRKIGINTDPVFPITYDGQQTDDGKSTYITVRGNF